MRSARLLLPSAVRFPANEYSSQVTARHLDAYDATVDTHLAALTGTSGCKRRDKPDLVRRMPSIPSIGLLLVEQNGRKSRVRVHFLGYMETICAS